MKGEITMIDRSGKTLVSGNIKSDKMTESSGITLGNSDSSAGSTGIQTSAADTDVLYPNLLTSYLSNLEKKLGYK